MARASIRVRGVTYTSPDAARVDAEQLRHHADELARDLRFDGKDAQAEQVQDRGHADAERLLEWARAFEAGEAEQTPQPADAPKPSRRSPSRLRSSTRPRGARRSPSTRRATPRLTPQTRTLIRRTGIPAAGSTASGLALQVAGMTIGVAFLTVLLTRRGVGAFGELAGGLGNGIRWIVDPVDPLAPRPKPLTPAQQRASSAATAAAGRTAGRAAAAIGAGF